ncbi:peptidylprolyl isomerase [Mollicutes bacterium LVI A0078]|nr:peptidylprolyl isomerase [Mollicutes bacterium LVI A0075]WOO90980.1 peptidylprolyl isomerase [Mollicutes bacterium LVI A0078]
MRKMVIVLVGCLVVLVALLVIISNMTPATDEAQSSEAAIAAAKEAREEISKESNPVATIVLTQNKQDYTFTFELFPDKAPQSVYNFMSLGNSGFYDGLTMHRVISSFVMQGGDPDGNGSGGPDYTITGEFPSNGVETGLSHQIGALAWARAAANDTAGSQFYIVLDDGVQYLDENYAVFGYMIDGFENLAHFNSISTTSQDAPENPITIKSVSIDTKGVDYPEPDKIEDYSELEENQ